MQDIQLDYNFDTNIAFILADLYTTHYYFDKAIDLYNNIIKLEPNNIACLNNLGSIYHNFIGILDNIVI